MNKVKRVFCYFAIYILLFYMYFFSATSVLAFGEGITERVSLGLNGLETNGVNNFGSVSEDGRYVAFISYATNLVSDDTNSFNDVFVYDRELRTTERVSVSSNESEADGNSNDVTISKNGRFVIFRSSASNLIPNDTNGGPYNFDVFVRDRLLGTTERVNLSTTEQEEEKYSPADTPYSTYRDYLGISEDGRYAAFTSYNRNLVPGANSYGYRVYIRDRLLETTEVVSLTTGGSMAGGENLLQDMTPDGRYLVFLSNMNLDPNDKNPYDVYLRDRALGVTELISVPISAGDFSDSSLQATISDDGRYVAFSSYANNLVGYDPFQFVMDVFIRDRVSQKTEHVGSYGNSHSLDPKISGDGKRVAFSSLANYFIGGDINGVYDVYLYEKDTNNLAIASVSSNGDLSNAGSGAWDISTDGMHIVFTTKASNLVMPSDTNNLTDVYIRNLRPPNQAPFANAGIDLSSQEGSLVTFDGSGSSDPDGTQDIVSYYWDFGDGTFGSGATVSHTYKDNGVYTATLTVADTAGATSTDTATITINNVVPMVDTISAPLDPQQVGTAVNVSANFTDPGVLDTHIAVWVWGDGTTSAGVIVETNGSGLVAGSHTYTAAGVYTVILTVTDKDEGAGQFTFRYIVIYDPEGGFVTGGGWINSPVGAYTIVPTLSGKANFGFVAKYQSGANIPTGNTKFIFSVANFNFQSTSYDWLVVSGPKAQYKGLGTINGSGDYGFLLTVNDGQVNGGGGTDRFRIKIWDKATGEIIYDNQMGEDDNANTSTTLGGGSIVIHKD